jgi:DNA-binding transcriptional ArsR family regulator
MSSGIGSLHKILKDENRRKIVLLLQQKGSLSYTELMNKLKVVSTGKINYHLKILGNIVAKNEEGKYVLTAKGLLASRFLTEFPDANNQQPGARPQWWRRFWIGTLAATIVVYSILTLAYVFGYISSSILYQNMVSFMFIIGFSYMIQHILRDVASRKTELAIAKTVYLIGGAVLGMVLAFLGGGLVFVGISRSLGKAFAPGDPFYSIFWSAWYLIFALLVAPTIGAVTFYRLGEKRGFRTQNYNPSFNQ